MTDLDRGRCALDWRFAPTSRAVPVTVAIEAGCVVPTSREFQSGGSLGP